MYTAAAVNTCEIYLVLFTCCVVIQDRIRNKREGEGPRGLSCLLLVLTLAHETRTTTAVLLLLYDHIYVIHTAVYTAAAAADM